MSKKHLAEDLYDYIAGRMDERDHRLAERHIKECHKCQKEVEELKATLKLLDPDLVKPPPIPPDFREKVLRSIYKLPFPHCAQELEGYPTNTTPRRAGEEFMKSFREQDLPSLLWLVGGKWYWGSKTGQSHAKLKQVNGEARITVGSWFLKPSQDVARSWGPAEKIRISTLLPEGGGEVTITVIPKRQSAHNRYILYFCFDLATPSQSRFIDVGVGTAMGCTTGMVELRSQRSVEFDLVPPTVVPYWAYFEWSAGGLVHHHRLELPIRSTEEELKP